MQHRSWASGSFRPDEHSGHTMLAAPGPAPRPAQPRQDCAAPRGGLPHALQPIEDADGAHHMRESVRCRPRALVLVRACRSGRVSESRVSTCPVDQPGAKLAQDGMVEAGIGKFRAQDMFQSMRLRTASAAQRSERPSSKLEKRGQRQAGRRFGGA